MDARCLLFQPLGAGAEGFEKKKTAGVALAAWLPPPGQKRFHFQL